MMVGLYVYVIFSYILLGIIFSVLIYKKRKRVKVYEYVALAFFFALAPLTLMLLVVSLDDIEIH